MTLDLPWNVEGDDEVSTYQLNFLKIVSKNQFFRSQYYFQFHLDVHQLIDDKWTYYVKEFDGDICTYLEEFLTVAWSKLKSAADPKVEDECSLPQVRISLKLRQLQWRNGFDLFQGKYSWTDFRLESSDVNVPSGMIGRFKLDLSIVRDAEAVFCKSIDLETKE